MGKDIIYGIQFKSIFHSYKQSCYFVSLPEAYKVSFYLNNLEENKKAGKIFMPFKTSKKSLEHIKSLLDKDSSLEPKYVLNRSKHRLGVKNYKIYNCAEDYIKTLTTPPDEQIRDL